MVVPRLVSRSFATLAMAALVVAMANRSGASPLSADGGPAACGWAPVSHPGSADPPFDRLEGIDARAAGDVWAVGSRGAQGATLVLHWNGTKWKIVPSPNPSSFVQLQDVTAISATNAWAVGWFVKSGQNMKTLALHWNGNKWKIIATPNPLAGTNNILKGVDAVSANNVWAVGSNGFPGNKTLILHWNGSQWSPVKGAQLPGGEGDLLDVSAISATNVVAVGELGATGDNDPLVERFNGTVWKLDEVPEAAHGNILTGVSTPSRDAQWAVGYRSGSSSLKTFSMRNKGSGWQIVPAADLQDLIALFNDVSALSAGNAWAVGEQETDDFVRRTMIQHFKNGQWRLERSRNVGAGHNGLFGVTALSHSLAWTVGTANRDIGSQGIIQRYSC